MKPIYFPYTYISKTSLNALKALFGRVALYQPDGGSIPAIIRELEEKKMIDIRVPVKGDEERLRAAITAFRSWADLHHGHGRETLKTVYYQTIDNPVPFIKDTYISKIREDIEREGRVTVSRPDPEFEARIFLSMAQLFDAQIDSIDQNLRVSNSMGKQLFKTLKGDPEAIDALSGVEAPAWAETAYDRKSGERMKAWSHLFIRDPEKANLFLTDRQGVMDTIIERSDELELAFTVDSLPIIQGENREFKNWRRDLAACLSGLAENQWTPASVRPIRPFTAENHLPQLNIKFYLSSGQTPDDFFRRFLGNEGDSPETKKKELNPRNTIIALVSYVNEIL